MFLQNHFQLQTLWLQVRESIALPKSASKRSKTGDPNQLVIHECDKVLIHQLNHPLFLLLKYDSPFFWRFPRVGIGWGKIQFARVMAYFRYRVTEYREYVRHRWRFELYRRREFYLQLHLLLLGQWSPLQMSVPSLMVAKAVFCLISVVSVRWSKFNLHFVIGLWPGIFVSNKHCNRSTQCIPSKHPIRIST